MADWPLGLVGELGLDSLLGLAVVLALILLVAADACAVSEILRFCFFQISLKTTECHSLQSEFDTLASTLKQLTNQKEVAQKRLDDLDAQVLGAGQKGSTNLGPLALFTDQLS